MSLERKDLRLKLDAQVHLGLQVLADVDGQELAAWAEAVMEAEVARRIHDARLISDRLPRSPVSGSGRE